MDWGSFEAVEEDRGREVIVFDDLVDRYEIPGIIASAAEDLRLYRYIKRYGWPYAGGWREQPAVFTDIVFALDDEAERIDAMIREG